MASESPQGDYGRSFQTLQDPRMASTPDLSRASSPSQSNDTKDEMTVLSDKLIAAINHQQALDDRLAQVQHELEEARSRATELERKSARYEEQIKSGELLTKTMAEKYSETLQADTTEAQRQRDAANREKQRMESELENLTASLFEEANKLVAQANEQRELTEKKNQQLRDQIKDGEALVASQNEQLAELKTLLQNLGSNGQKDAPESPSLTVTAAPRSPKGPKEESPVVKLLEAMNLSPVGAEHPEVAPMPATQLSHLVRLQCRTDIPAYEDFKHMLQASAVRSHTPSHAPSRAGSGSYGGLSGLGLGGMSHANSSNSNLASSKDAPTKTSPSPNLPGSFSPAVDSRGPAPLRDTKFFKRLISEDVEPTLRLDLSPSISWLQKRAILAAVTDSTLIVEPIPEASQRLYGRYTPCSICGESRTGGQNTRTHAMRVKEGEGASKWSVCQLCLEKVRGVGDLIGYTRMVRDGVVKIADLKDEEEAWEEVIRLRERLFWSRMAGGVVPAFVPTPQHVAVNSQPEDTAMDEQENKSPGFATPAQSRRVSEEEEDARELSPEDRAANAQMQRMNDALTTFDDARRKIASEHVDRTASPAIPPTTPSRRKEGSGSSFPKINIPKIPQLPQGFWDTQVNSLR